MPELQYRPVNLRLQVAFVADAYYAGFPETNPGHSLDRVFESNQYKVMWQKINEFYCLQGWDKLCNERLEKDVLSSWINNGFRREDNTYVSPEQVRESVNRFLKYGWIDYEKNRQDKINNVVKYSNKVAGLLFAVVGISALGEGD